MPPKRKADNSGEEGSPKKKPAAPRLKKTKQPDWAQDEKPTGEWALKCVERWCLLPPYNKKVPDGQWKQYYEERVALEEINTEGSDKCEPIVSEELGQDTFRILRTASLGVAASILGAASVDEEQRKAIAHTLMGSLYLLSCWGNDEEGGGDNPRTVNVKTRLYSPFGLGTSLDLEYNYHWRQFRAGERFSDFVVRGRTAQECNPGKPTECSTTERNKNGRPKPAEGAVRVFDMNNSKIVGTTAKNLEGFEMALFGTDGWLSPLKIFSLLCAAGTVMHYKENNGGTVKKAGLDKFKLFQGETDGRDAVKEEIKRLQEVEDKKEKCVPKRMLALAKSGTTTNAITETDMRA